MTKFIDKTELSTKKPTELLFYSDKTNNYYNFVKSLNNPHEYQSLEYIGQDTHTKLDIILATDKRGGKVLYLGHWNDGC